MGKIITLKDKVTQENTYPVTSIDAVLMEDGQKFSDRLDLFFRETEETLTNTVALAQAAEDSIVRLTNLNNTGNYQEEIEALLSEVRENKQKLISLETEYKDIQDRLSNLLTKDDITNDIKGESDKIPTGMVVRNYVADSILGAINGLINTTGTTPEHVTNTGQILINEETSEIYISPSYGSFWLKLKATPIQLDPDNVFDANIIDGDTLEMTGNVGIKNSTVTIPSTEKVEDDTLIV